MTMAFSPIKTMAPASIIFPICLIQSKNKVSFNALGRDLTAFTSFTRGKVPVQQSKNRRKHPAFKLVVCHYTLSFHCLLLSQQVKVELVHFTSKYGSGSSKGSQGQSRKKRKCYCSKSFCAHLICPVLHAAGSSQSRSLSKREKNSVDPSSLSPPEQLLNKDLVGIFYFLHCSTVGNFGGIVPILYTCDI